MENYKQKYKEALDNFKKIKAANKDNKELVDFIEYEYPELKESEDESVRKHLLKHFMAKTKEEWNGMPIKNIIAWLEKQGEQTSADDLRRWNELTWEDINTLEELMAKVHYEFRNGIGAESFGKEVLERFREIKGDEYTDTWEHKHNWSEEDEEMIEGLNSCLDELEEANGWRFTYVNNKDLELCEVRNWLKFLKERYFWKPSDEQIKALNYVVNLMASSESPTENDYYYNVFKDMRTQLKKLKE